MDGQIEGKVRKEDRNKRQKWKKEDRQKKKNRRIDRQIKRIDRLKWKKKAQTDTEGKGGKKRGWIKGGIRKDDGWINKRKRNFKNRRRKERKKEAQRMKERKERTQINRR